MASGFDLLQVVRYTAFRDRFAPKVGVVMTKAQDAQDRCPRDLPEPPWAVDGREQAYAWRQAIERLGDCVALAFDVESFFDNLDQDTGRPAQFF